MERKTVNGKGERILPPGWRPLSTRQKRLTLRVLERREFTFWQTPAGIMVTGPGMAGGAP